MIFLLLLPCCLAFFNNESDIRCESIWLPYVKKIPKTQCSLNSLTSKSWIDGDYILFNVSSSDDIAVGRSLLDSSTSFPTISDIALGSIQSSISFNRLSKAKNGTNFVFRSTDGLLALNLKNSDYLVFNGPVPISHPAYRFPPSSASIIKRIYLLVLDSTSRLALRAFAPSTKSFLENNNFVFFPGFGPVSPGGTRAALSPMLYGGFPSNCPEILASESILARLLDFSAIADRCSHPERRLLKLAREKFGFRTAIVEMTGSSMYLTRNDVDNHLSAFPFRALSKLKGETAHYDTVCLGDRRGIEHMLQYSEDFLFKAEPAEQPKLIITHLSASHESPASLVSIDEAISSHLDNIIQRDPNALLFVMGDHGLTDITCDYRRPFLAIRTSNSEWEHNLKAIGDGNVSPWDLYATLRFAISGNDSFNAEEFKSYATRNASFQVQAMAFSKFDKRIYFNPFSGMKPLNLLSDPFPLGRSCLLAGRSHELCSDSVNETLASVTLEGWICGETPKHLQRLTQDFSNIRTLHRQGSPGLFTFCQQYLKVAEQAVLYINNIIGNGHTCPAMSLGYLESVVLDHDTGLYDLIVHVTIPTFNKVLATFFFRLADTHTLGLLSMRMIQFKQLTRFKPHEACTPKGMNPEICLCAFMRNN